MKFPRLLFACVSLSLLFSCITIKNYPEPTETPIPTPTPVQISTPVPVPIEPLSDGPYVQGRVQILVENTQAIPFYINKQNPNDQKNLDDIVVAAFTGEKEGTDLSQPILGLHFRGPSPEKAGALIRFSANIAYDRDHEESPTCSAGMEYGQRIGPMEDGIYVIEWNEIGATLEIPSGKKATIYFPKSRTAAFSRVVPGLPWPRQPKSSWRYLLWGPQFSFLRSDINGFVQVASWEGEKGLPSPCP